MVSTGLRMREKGYSRAGAASSSAPRADDYHRLDMLVDIFPYPPYPPGAGPPRGERLQARVPAGGACRPGPGYVDIFLLLSIPPYTLCTLTPPYPPGGRGGSL